MVTMKGQAEGARVNAWKRSSWPRPPKVYARTSPFFFLSAEYYSGIIQKIGMQVYSYGYQ